jgi:phosphoglycerate dehydrogenase-like enzyme
MGAGAKKRVLLALYSQGERLVGYARQLEEQGFEVRRNPHRRFFTEDELCEALDGAFAVVAGGEAYTERVFRAAPQLQIVARWGVGYERVDVPAATRHGVAVAMAFGCNHEAVADCTLVLMGTVAEKLILHDRRVKAGGWGYEPHRGLWRATVGIIGLGRIGKAVARRCRGFDMRVLAHDVQPDRAFAEAHRITFVPLETLLREADFVTLHGPQTAETTHLINRERLACMKPTAILINTARGGLVDESALYEALVSGRIAGAGLDVFQHEPATGSPLLGLDTVVCTPHMGGNDLSAQELTADCCLQAIMAVAQGRSPNSEYLLNPEVFTSQRKGSGGVGRLSEPTTLRT